MKSPSVCFSIGALETELTLPKKVKRVAKTKTIISNTIFDVVFGFGLAKGSTFIISGKAGTGKTTILLNHMQAVYDFDKKVKVAFLSNEMDISKLSIMCERLGVTNVLIAHMKDIEKIIKVIETFDYVVIDSIQGIRVLGVSKHDEPEEAINRIVEASNLSGCAVGVISHITKGGKVKGNSSIGHIVDCNISLYRASKRYTNWDSGIIVYVDKNRNGPSGYFPMKFGTNGVELYTYLDRDCFLGLLSEIPPYAIVKG